MDAKLKELYKNTFDVVAEGYGHSAMRFFSESAERLASLLMLTGDEHVLDVATGTGYAALAIARALPEGQVTGIDFSQGMLAQAEKNRNAQGIDNVSFNEMDMQCIEYPDSTFDAATSAFSIFFVEDMRNQLLHIASKVKEGGKVLTTTFFETSFSPLVNIFLNRLEEYGVEIPSLAWKRVATQKQCISLFEEAGLEKVKSTQMDCDYYLEDPADWWYIIWNGGFRGLVNQLSPHDFEKFKIEHLAEVQQLRTDQGILLEMSILYTLGEKGKSHTTS